MSNDNDDFDMEKTKGLAMAMAAVMKEHMSREDYYSGEILMAIEGVYRGALITSFESDIFALRDYIENFKSGTLDILTGGVDSSEFEVINND